MKGFFSTCIIFVSVTLGLGVMEVALRCGGFLPARLDQPHCERWARPDPRLGWRNRPGVWKVDCLNNPMTILPNGLRKTCGQDRGSATGPRILILGDSWIMGFGLHDEETFASLLQKRFPSVRFLNCAVAGYGTYQSLLFLEDFLAEAKKSQDKQGVRVLYCFCSNHQERNVASYHWIRGLTTYDRTHFTPPHILRDDAGHWRRYPAERHNMWSLADKSALVYLLQDRIIYQVTRDNGDQAIAATRHLMREMHQLCEHNGVPFEVVLAFSPQQERKRYQAFCRSSAIPCVSCAPDVLWKDPEWFLHKGDYKGGHPNERLHAYWAASIGEFLHSEGWVNP
jgi:hypothetical protein